MFTGLDGELWLYGTAAVFVVGHLLAFAYYVRRASVATAGGAPATADRPTERTDPPATLPPVDADETVRCPHCSVENEAGYRFCRYCVGELGGAEVGTGSGSSPRSRGMF